MKAEVLLDIIFCAIVLPGVMFLFPTGEWITWQPDYILGYVLWLYATWALSRWLLGPMLQRGRASSKITAVGVFFLMGVVTFLMTLSPTNLPNDTTARVGQMLPHVRAMWVLFVFAASIGLSTGILASRISTLTTVKEVQDAHANATKALEIKRSEAEEVTGEEIQIKADYKVVHLPLSVIQYIEGRNNYACFHLDHRADIVSQISLKAVMDMLPEGQFTRIHRSYIVPDWRIEKRTAADVQLMGVKERLPIGRAYKDNLKNG